MRASAKKTFQKKSAEDVSALVPAPEHWLASDIPVLAETAEFVQYLVKKSKGCLLYTSPSPRDS